MSRSVFSKIIILLVILTFQSVSAQVGPSSIEGSQYNGLHLAAYSGDAAALTQLINKDVDLEVRDSAGRTPIIVAAFASHENLVRLLAEAGADINALENQAYDVVTIAAVANDLPMLDIVLELGASSGNITSPYEGTALIAAAHLGHHEVVKRLIEADAPLDHINNLHWTALIESVVLGSGGPEHIETARLLLTAGADKTIADKNGVTPLQHAVSRGYKEMVRLFEQYK